MVLSDRRLQTPVLATTKDAVSRGGLLELEIEIPDAQGMHAVKLRARTPNGEEAPWFKEGVIVEDGSVRISLPIAHNEQDGEWKVTATDLYTGESAGVSFVVE